MRWRIADAEAYLHAADYIDTAVIPLISIKADHQFKASVEKGEFTQLICEELERQLKGRVYLFPAYTYIDINETTIQELRYWKKEAGSRFRHVVFLTAEANWEDAVSEEKVVYIPSVPFEHMNDSLKRRILEDKTGEILNVLLQLWGTL
ncbi:YpiF family protein [Bacillus atrophaeus]|uniref:YpiF family protein n=1 Tax=Bacillus atrophaeus TaxID=1452 RepID=UPI002281CEAE|nr:YpiF family protein [Bacillus atrophaeus]MCY9161366.1 YpiF family protein [Bacillus atrophaeus]